MNTYMDSNTQRLREWLESGKQIGKTFSYQKNNEVCWSSVAIQKHNQAYKLFLDEIYEKDMASEVYQREELIVCSSVDEVFEYLVKNSNLELGQLTPLKGRKIFRQKGT